MKTLHKQIVLGLFAGALAFAGCKKDKLIKVSGTVKGTDGTTTENLQGVMVTSEGSVIDTALTDASGTYNIDVAKNGVLKFEKVGYQTQTVDVEGEETVDVTLQFSGFAGYFTAAGNAVADPGFTAGSIQPTGSGLPTALAPIDNWFQSTNYIGAVSPTGTAWYNGWSFYANIVSGNLNSPTINLPTPVKEVNEAMMTAAGDTIYWVNDTLYKLDGFVFVNDGQVLMIEAGTVIQGKAGSGASASALIVARGGKIFAQGTATAPIIFTFDGDGGNTPATTRGQWGGLLVLGKARLNSTPGTTQIEGIPTTETRGSYGGNNDADNSGIIRYVSIRHGGTNIGADNEINGLTLGGVGSGTVIEFVEVVGNDDDGIECFGGTANIKNAIIAYCADDAYDYDEGYRGKNQFVIIHQDPTAGSADRGGEHDGGTDPEAAQPYAIPVFYNVTSIGNPATRALTFRDNAGGKYYNSIFVGYSKGVDIQDKTATDQDSYRQWQDGNLELEHNAFFNIGAGNQPGDIFKVTVL